MRGRHEGFVPTAILFTLPADLLRPLALRVWDDQRTFAAEMPHVRPVGGNEGG